MPEGRINLAQAIIALALAPKSNAVIMAIDAAMADVTPGRIGLVPAPPARRALPRREASDTARATSTPMIIRTASRPSSTCPTSWPAPEYYRPTDHGAEAGLADRLTKINELLGRDPPADQ